MTKSKKLTQKRKLTETYYAIRVGKFESDRPYFMVNDDCLPIIEEHRDMAKAYVSEPFHHVVKVKIVEQ